MWLLPPRRWPSFTAAAQSGTSLRSMALMGPRLCSGRFLHCHLLSLTCSADFPQIFVGNLLVKGCPRRVSLHGDYGCQSLQREANAQVVAHFSPDRQTLLRVG